MGLIVYWLGEASLFKYRLLMTTLLLFVALLVAVLLAVLLVVLLNGFNTQGLLTVVVLELVKHNDSGQMVIVTGHKLRLVLWLFVYLLYLIRQRRIQNLIKLL